jgi:hypothetical protein
VRRWPPNQRLRVQEHVAAKKAKKPRIRLRIIY